MSNYIAHYYSINYPKFERYIYAAKPDLRAQDG